MKQTSHGINVFEEIDSSLSFKEFRDILAALTQEEAQNPSDMEIIDKLFTEYVELAKSAAGDAQSYAERVTKALQDAVETLIDKDDNGNIIIGGGSENGSNVIINDGLGTQIVNGILTILGVQANDFIRTKNYVAKEIEVNGAPHLRISYSPKLNTGGEA